MAATLAGGALAGGGGLDKTLGRRGFLQLVKNALVGGDDEGVRVQLPGGLDDAGGGADHIGLFEDGRRGLRVRQHFRLGVALPEFRQFPALEFLVDDATALPQDHLGPGLLLHIFPQIFVRRPDDLLSRRRQALDHLHRAAGGDHPVGPGLHRGAGVGVDHHSVIGMTVAEGPEFVGGATQVQGAFRMEVRHQHPFFRVQDLGGFAHEAHAADDKGGGVRLVAEPGHVQGVGDATAGLVGKPLQVGVRVVVGDHHGVLFPQALFDLVQALVPFPLAQGLHHRWRHLSRRQTAVSERDGGVHAGSALYRRAGR